nr:PREDICTED: uncharacterized protein LOC107398800 [Tribolium castaneum]|eukprot:XP_015839707.1 PREDICTED: uncharacterized protein LOC107398800 [Tribolium castaneum]
MDSNNMNNDDHEPVYASGGKLIFANEENRKLVLVQNKNNGDLMYALYEDIQEIFNLEPLSKETKKTDETLHHDEMKNNVIETTCDEEGESNTDDILSNTVNKKWSEQDTLLLIRTVEINLNKFDTHLKKNMSTMTSQNS